MCDLSLQVIAVVMDIFTDVDIFRDLLDAGFKRKVSVYILLERTTIPHFLSMCQRANMHAGHLKVSQFPVNNPFALCSDMASRMHCLSFHGAVGHNSSRHATNKTNNRLNKGDKTA